MDYEGEINLGSVKEASLRDIWSGEKLARIRDGMKKAFLTEEVCQRCQGEIKGPHKTDVLKCAP
jgi:hypothetical protein